MFDIQFIYDCVGCDAMDFGDKIGKVFLNEDSLTRTVLLQILDPGHCEWCNQTPKSVPCRQTPLSEVVTEFSVQIKGSLERTQRNSLQSCVVCQCSTFVLFLPIDSTEQNVLTQAQGEENCCSRYRHICCHCGREILCFQSGIMKYHFRISFAYELHSSNRLIMDR